MKTGPSTAKDALLSETPRRTEWKFHCLVVTVGLGPHLRPVPIHAIHLGSTAGCSARSLDDLRSFSILSRALQRRWPRPGSTSFIGIPPQGPLTMRATQYVATVRLMESRFQRPPFRPVLSQLVLRAIVHTIQEYLLALLKPTSIVLWHSLTSLRLGSDTTGQIVIPCVHCLRRVLSALRTLQVLRLNRFAWPASSDNLPIADFLPSPSFSQPKDLSIWAERDWLLDRRSAYLVTWIARSGMASTLQAIHLEWMTILNEPLLMAVASVIEASSGTLRGILVRAGPDISLSPLLSAFSRCSSLEQLYIHLPYHSPAFRLCTQFVQQLRLKRLRRLNIRLDSYPGCARPDQSTWTELDLALQALECQRLDCISVLKLSTHVDSEKMLWGNIYLNGPYDPVAWRTELAHLLRVTHSKRQLHYCDHVYGPPVLVPNRVHLTLPVEVCERTIDFVAGTRNESLGVIWASGVTRTLQTCALTCRAWRLRAQAHLFRVVRVRCTLMQAYSITDFVDLLRKHPALRAFVHTCIADPGINASPPTLHTIAVYLPNCLLRLEHLRLSDGILYPAPGFEVCMRQFSSVTTLSMFQVTFHSLTTLRRTISSCRNLKVVHVLMCQWHGKYTGSRLGSFPNTSVRLTDLVIASDASWALDQRSTGLLRWLARSGATSAVTGLFLHLFVILNPTVLAAVDELICASKKSLADLYLSFAPDLDFTSLSGTLALCTNLGFVALRLPYCTETFSNLIALFSTEGVGSTTRRGELHLWLRFHEFPGAAEPTATDWAALDDALELPIFDSVEALTIGRWPLHVPAGAPIVWGDRYGYARTEADPAVGEGMKALLPKAMKRKRLLWDKVL